MLQFFFDSALAGIWAEIWKFGAGTGVIVLLCAAAYFSPLYKKEFIYGAMGVAGVLFAYTYGVHDGAARARAQEIVVEQKVDKAVKDAQTPGQAGANDPWNNSKN
jgi:hypothetical protein